jgi:hypothetical protein
MATEDTGRASFAAFGRMWIDLRTTLSGTNAARARIGLLTGRSRTSRGFVRRVAGTTLPTVRWIGQPRTRHTGGAKHLSGVINVSFKTGGLRETFRRHRSEFLDAPPAFGGAGPSNKRMQLAGASGLRNVGLWAV